MTTPRLTDIHCHLLPGLDDGAADWDAAMAMARLAVADGTATIVATPHQLGENPQCGGAQIRAQAAELQSRLRRESIALEVLPGAEVRIEPELVSKLQNGEVLTLADRRRHVLIELPHDVYFPIDRVLGELRAIGITGILAHPERNAGLRANPELIASLVRAGCLMQVTAGSLTGTFGPEVELFTRSLIQRGLVHLVATDAHGAKARRPLLGRGFERIVHCAGQETALDLCCRNPALVAAGQSVPVRRVAPPQAKRSWFSWRRAG